MESINNFIDLLIELLLLFGTGITTADDDCNNDDADLEDDDDDDDRDGTVGDT